MKYKIVFGENLKLTFRASNLAQLLKILAYIIYPFFPVGIEKIVNKDEDRTIEHSDFSELEDELRYKRLRLQAIMRESNEEIPRKPKEIIERYKGLREEAQCSDSSVVELILEDKKRIDVKFGDFEDPEEDS